MPDIELDSEAIRSRWFFRYLDASEGDWKVPLDNWLLPRNDSTLRRGITITNTSSTSILRRVPLDLLYLRLALSPTSHTCIQPKEVETREEALAEPIFRSLRFKLPKTARTNRKFMELHLDCWVIADLWNYDGDDWWTAEDMVDFAIAVDAPNPPDIVDMSYLLARIKGALPSRIRQLVEQGHTDIFPIPPELRKTPIILDVSTQLHSAPILVKVEVSPHSGLPTRVTSGFLTVLGTFLPAYAAWHVDISLGRPTLTTTSRGLVYVHGAAERSYPHPASWHLQSTEFQQSVTLNKISSAKISEANSNRIKSASSIIKWSSLLHRKLDATQIFRATTRPSILTRKDRNTRLKLLHRALAFNRRRPSPDWGTRCRLCQAHEETHLHLTACYKIRPVWVWIFNIISEFEKTKITPTASKIILGIRPKGAAFTSGSITLLDLAWKVVYWHLWRETLDDIPFHHDQVISTILERLHNTIAGHQSNCQHLQRNGRTVRFKKSKPLVKKYCGRTWKLIIHPAIAGPLQDHGWIHPSTDA